jgi:DHA2 family multidrug resistance protein
MTTLTVVEKAPVPGRAIVTIASMTATLMQALDNTIANVALPYMQGTFSTTLDQITWVLTSYIVAAAIMTAPVGWMASRFGRKNFFVFCVAGFTIASVLCGLAETLPQMVVFRLLQGMCGAALVPLSQVTMLDLYPVEQRGNAMALWGMGVMVGPILGPTLGGYLTDIYNWRWVFYINVPFGILAMVGLWFFLPDTGRDRKLQFDWIGFGVLSLGIGALQLMLDRGEQLDWFNSPEIVAELVLGGLGIYLFVVHLFTADKPFIAPSIFRDTNFVAGILVMFAMGVVLLASSALLAPYLQNLGGYSVSEAGLLMVPRGVGTMIAMMIAGRLVNRADPRLLILSGIIVLAVTMWQMSEWTPDISVWSLTVTTLLQGFGLGFVFIPLNVVAFTTLPADRRTDGTALFSLMRNVGGAVGISVMSFLLAQNTQILHARIAEHVTPFNRMLQSHGAYLFWNVTKPQGLHAMNAEITRQATIMAYANDFRLMFLISAPVALLLLFMRRPRMTSVPSDASAAMD